MNNYKLFSLNSNRSNIRYVVSHAVLTSQDVELDIVKLLKTVFGGSSGIIYCQGPAECEKLQTLLVTVLIIIYVLKNVTCKMSVSANVNSVVRVGSVSMIERHMKI